MWKIIIVWTWYCRDTAPDGSWARDRLTSGCCHADSSGRCIPTNTDSNGNEYTNTDQHYHLNIDAYANQDAVSDNIANTYKNRYSNRYPNFHIDAHKYTNAYPYTFTQCDTISNYIDSAFRNAGTIGILCSYRIQ